MEIISIVVISYNRPKETVEALQNILFEVEGVPGFEKEVIVINNGSTIDYAELEAFIEKNNKGIKYIDNPENLGVSGGRNLGIDHSRGRYIVFIDDDAVFKNGDALQLLHDKFLEYADQNVGIIGFGVENFYNGEPDHPVKDLSKLKEDEFLNNIFWGCGFAFKREIVEKIGRFDDSFFYGMEEYDIGYRAMDQGYKILFTKKITVLHKVSPKGRETNLVKYSRMFVNKCLIAYRYLPWRYFFSHVFMWGGFLLLQSKGNIFFLFRNISKLRQKIKVNERKPISGEAIAYIQSVSGRLTH